MCWPVLCVPGVRPPTNNLLDHSALCLFRAAPGPTLPMTLLLDSLFLKVALLYSLLWTGFPNLHILLRSQNFRQLRKRLNCLFNMSFVCMAPQWTEDHNSSHKYGGVFARPWVQRLVSRLVFILRLMDNVREPIRTWKLLYVVSLLKTPPPGVNTFHGWNMPTTASPQQLLVVSI